MERQTTDGEKDLQIILHPEYTKNPQNKRCQAEQFQEVQKFEQILHQRRDMNGKQAQEQMFNISSP